MTPQFKMDAAIALGDIEGLRKLLSEKGTHDLDWMMHQAAKCGNKEMVEMLLNLGAKIPEGGGQALKWAIESGCKETVTLLLDQGAGEDPKWQGSIIGACQEGQTEITALLIARGADPKTTFNAPLRWAAKNRRDGTLEMLLTLYEPRELKAMLKEKNIWPSYPKETIKKELEKRMARRLQKPCQSQLEI
jgi:ankyrin repeat protein